MVEVTGVAAALQQALEYVAWEGRVSLLGCTRIPDVPIDFYKYVHRRGISLIGAHTFARARQESAPGRWTTRNRNGRGVTSPWRGSACLVRIDGGRLRDAGKPSPPRRKVPFPRLWLAQSGS